MINQCQKCHFWQKRNAHTVLFTATEHAVKILLTRNLKDYKSAEIPIMTAEQFIDQAALNKE